MARLIVGVAGPMGSGKDTVAACLVERFGFVRLGMADALKREVSTIWRRTLDAHLHQTYGASEMSRVGLDEMIRRSLYEHRTPVTRALLQEHGTELRRAEDPDYWVARWTATARSIQGSVVCPDVRFPNELAALRALGGVLVVVERPGYLGTGHASETSLEGVVPDITFVNDGTVLDLWARVSEWITPLFTKREAA